MSQRYVWLDSNEPRCVPSVSCSRAPACARSIVTAHVGRPVQDYPGSVHNWSPEKCTGWLSASDHRSKPVETKVHEAPRGIL